MKQKRRGILLTTKPITNEDSRTRGMADGGRVEYWHNNSYLQIGK